MELFRKEVGIEEISDYSSKETHHAKKEPIKGKDGGAQGERGLCWTHVLFHAAQLGAEDK